jgi:hypothetical protein
VPTEYTSLRVSRETHELICRLARLEERPVGLTVARLVRDAAEQAGVVQPKRTKTSVRRKARCDQ